MLIAVTKGAFKIDKATKNASFTPTPVFSGSDTAAYVAPTALPKIRKN